MHNMHDEYVCSASKSLYFLRESPRFIPHETTKSLYHPVLKILAQYQTEENNLRNWKRIIQDGLLLILYIYSSTLKNKCDLTRLAKKNTEDIQITKCRNKSGVIATNPNFKKRERERDHKENQHQEMK